ncbi:unnamed protein product, partial [Urochloa humidicola]
LSLFPHPTLAPLLPPPPPLSSSSTARRRPVPMLSAAPHWIPGSNRADRCRLSARFRAGCWRQLELAAAGKVGGLGLDAWYGEMRQHHVLSTLSVYLKHAAQFCASRIMKNIAALKGKSQKVNWP